MAEIRSGRRAERRAQQQADRQGRPQQPQRAAVVEERKRSRIPFVAFTRESWAELKKVEWPGQSQVVQGTVVVLIACIVVGIFLYANDQVWKEVVTKVLLGQ